MEAVWLRSVAVAVLFLVSIGFTGVHSQDCQTSLTRPDGSVVCYYSVGTIVTWDTARRNCLSRGQTWHLATVTSLEENNKLTSIMDASGVSTSWIGASEEVSTWKWLDGSEVGYQGCYRDNSTLRDMDSVTNLGNASSVARCVEICNASSYAYAGLEARNECWCGNRFGRYGQSADATCNVACVGVQSGQTCGGESALDVYAVSGAYSNWMPGRPLNSAGNANCAVMDSAVYQWGTTQCGASYSGAFCDIGVMDEQTCRNSSSAFFTGGRCIDVINGVAMTYFAAHARCKQRGGELAQLKTYDNNQDAKRFLLYLQNEALNGGGAVSGGFWIGLVRTRWSWESGDDFLFTNWLAGGPSAPVDGSQCAAISWSSSSSSSSNGYWSNVACNSAKFFVCQSVTASTRTTTPVQPTRSTLRRLSTTTTLNNNIVSSGSTTTVINNNNNNNNASDAATTTVASGGDASGVKKSGSTLSAGALAGIICGSVGFVQLLVLIVGIICCCRKCKRSNSSPAHKTGEPTSANDVEKTQVPEDDSKLQQTTKVANPADGNYYFGITIEDLKEPVTADPTYEWIDNPKQPDVVPSVDNTLTPQSPPADVYANNCEIMIMPKETPKPKKTKKDSTSTENVYADCSPNTTL